MDCGGGGGYRFWVYKKYVICVMVGIRTKGMVDCKG